MKIAVLTSGGVDSSVALKLLKNQGHDVTAFYLKIWLEDELKYLGSCPWEEDLAYVRQICEKEKIPLKIINLQKEYFDSVVKYTLKEVKAGRTPNPDIMCNNNIKFGFFLEKTDSRRIAQRSVHYDKIATGHYAQIAKKDGKYFLEKSPDKIKDQTYFLANLKQNQLKRLIFPIGNFKKEEVRKLAKKFNLPNKNRKDSQGICFLGKLKYPEFLKHYLGEKKGDIIEFETNEKIGEHEGYWYYTIGQRKGIKLSGGPWFVVKKDIKKNKIYISKKYNEKKRNELEVTKFNWFLGEPKKVFSVKLRHGEHSYKCKIKFLGKDRAKVTLNSRDQGIAPGQFAVFYSGKKCLGCGVISG